MKIEQSDVVETALSLVDEEGLAKFNMRAVASRLGVQQSALYWHVGDKAELIDLMAGSFYRRAFEAAPAEASWREWLFSFGSNFRASLLAHRDSAKLCAIAKPARGHKGRAADGLIAVLLAQGLTRHTALSYQASVIALVLGWAIYEQSDALHGHLAEMIGFDQSFATGLRSLTTGFPDAG